VYKSSAPFIKPFAFLPAPAVSFLIIDSKGFSKFKFSPNLTSRKRFFTSPNCTCEFTTPRSNSFLYLTLAAVSSKPTPVTLPKNLFIGAPVCNGANASPNALPTTTGFSKKTPFAAENPVAENIFLKCVTGASIVFATCDAAFGNKIKLRYPHVKPFSTPVAPGLGSNKNFNALDESPNPSAIAFDVNLPC